MLKVSQQLDFREPTPADAEWMTPLLSAEEHMGCEYAFATIFMWRKYYHTYVARADEFLFVKSQEEKHSYLPPIGGRLEEGMALLSAYVHEKGHPLKLFGADSETVQRLETLYPGRFTFTPAPNDFDYLYRSEDLAELAGKKYHGKRNHISAFSARYDWQYEPITAENIPEVEEMAREWCRLKGNCQDKGLRSENCAIREALSVRQQLNLTGGLIRVDGRVVAFTFGSPINSTVFDVQVEKALPDYAGAYTVINREFVAHELRGYTYINRENDLGIEGLRRAKKSYYPAILLEKFVCTENT